MVSNHYLNKHIVLSVCLFVSHFAYLCILTLRSAPAGVNTSIPHKLPGSFLSCMWLTSLVLTLLVDTSNVDGHWKRHVHNEELYEIHGSIDYWQCSQPCCRRLWKPPKGFMFEINEETMIAPLKEAPLPDLISDGEPLVDEMIAPHFASNRPTCPFCGRPARPYVSV